MSEFQGFCLNGHIPLGVGRIYTPERPGSGPWYGPSPVQRDTLVLAVEGGYYAIPRRTKTKDLADELGISDEAVTERLRRAIARLVENTLIVSMEAEEFGPLQYPRYRPDRRRLEQGVAGGPTLPRPFEDEDRQGNAYPEGTREIA